MTRFRKMWALLGVAAALVVPRLDAQENDEGPALGVARVSLTNGDVTVRRGDSGDWVEARVNTPLVEDDTIATGPGSRAEVQLDYSNLIRLNENTEVTMASLANRSFRVQLGRGILTYSELKGGEADVDIETPHVAVRPRKNGRYRVEVLGDETAVTVRRGEAEIASAQGVETLKSGRTMLIRGEGDEVAFRIVDADPRDEWDEWNERRDSVLNKSDSYRYLSRSISGGYDLDGHGNWRYVSGYGYSWFPSVTVGWAPYRHGRWVWLDYYGWTWQSYESWGWAPYHYGRWYRHASYGWGWYPGVYHHRHHWRPALVAFFGWGSHSGFNVGVGFGHGYGHVGWVPLGPGEAYYPWYGRHFYGRGRHGGNTTIYVDNSVNIYNNYRNARHNNGVTVVDANGFSRGQVNNPRSLRDTELRRATLMRGQIPVVPARESRGRVVRAANSSAANNGRSRGGVRQNAFFNRDAGRRTVRAGNGRVSFDQQRDQMQRSIRAYADNGGRRSVGASGAAGSQGRVDRAGVTNGRTQRAGGAGVRGTDASVDAGRTRLEDRSNRTTQAVGRAGVRGSDTTGARDAQRRTATTGRTTTGTEGSSGAGVRSRATETTNQRGSDWRQFGNAGSSSRTVDRGTSRARSSSSATIDRSNSRNDRGSRVERTSPSRSDSNNSATRSRGNSASSASRVERSRSVQRAPQQRSAPVQRSAPSRAPSVERSAPSRAPSAQRSSPRAAPSNGGGGSSSRSNRGRSRSELRGSNDSGFTRFGSTSSTSARTSRADQGRSAGRFTPRAASRVSSSSSSRGSVSRSRSPSSARVGSSRSSAPGRDSRVSRSTASRGGFSMSRSTAGSSPRIRNSSPRASRGGGGRNVSPSRSGVSRSSRPSISRSRSVSARSRGARSSGRSISRGGGISRSSGGGRSVSRGGSSRGSVSRSSGGARGGRSRGR